MNISISYYCLPNLKVVENNTNNNQFSPFRLSSNLDMYTLEFKDYGKNFIKTHKMSPDSFIQMAMQYAFYR